MKFRTQIQNMAESEIKAMISPEKLAEIKAKDKSPIIKAFVVGHEGEAKGNVIGVGNIVKKWFGDMVEKLHDKIRIGLQLFHGHAATNDTAGRIPIAEVVGKKLMKIKDRISSVVACWIYSDYQHLPLDVASIEADVDLRGDSTDRLYVSDVSEISGIALGNSQIETPGFPGATLLGQLQAFVEKQSLKITLFGGENKMDMSLADVKKAIQEAKLKPTDLFDREVILADPLISEQVKEKITNATGYNYRKTEELTEEKVALGQKLKEAEAKIAEIEKEKQTIRLEAAKSQIGSLFEKQKAERKLDDKQEKFIKLRLERFTPTKAEEIEKEFNGYLDAEIDEYKKISKEVYGIEGDGGNGKPAGGEPDTGKGGSPEDKYLDPAQNPMIKADAD